MKRSFIVIALSVMLLTMMGCMTVEEWESMEKSEGVKEETSYSNKVKFTDDIDNPSYSVRLELKISETDKFLLKYIVPKKPLDGTKNIVFLSIVFNGSDWRFMEGDIKIKIDDNETITYTDNRTSRDVLSGGNVMEIITITILDGDENIKELSEIKDCNSLVIQYWLEPIKFDDKQLTIVKDFINKYYGLTYEDLEKLYNQQQ